MVQLQQRAILACLFGWLILGATIWIVVTQFAIPVRAGIQAAGVYCLINIWLVYHLPKHLPQHDFGWANSITLVRAAGTAFLAGFVAIERAAVLAWPILLLALVLLLLDGLDGWLARRYMSASAFGARFDMETDALFILIIALLAWQMGKAPAWVLLAGAWRYAFIVGGWLYPKLAAPLAPSKRRQTACVIQIIGLLICLYPSLPRSVTEPLVLVSLIVLSASFCIDIYRLATTAHAAA